MRRDRRFSLSRRALLRGGAGLIGGALCAGSLPVPSARAQGAIEGVSITTNSGLPALGALSLPDRVPAPAVLVLHDWWGLTRQTKAVAAELAGQGYVALALDFYDGLAAEDGARETARQLAEALRPARAADIATSWVTWLREHPAATGAVGAVGWSLGGGWALNTSILTPVDATVLYYGRVNRLAADLKRLKGPVLGHYGRRDHWVNQRMVEAFEREMDAAAKAYISRWYGAEHAFANPADRRYQPGAARLAWDRTLTFFDEQLRPRGRG